MILTFPKTLAADVTQGGAHVSFEIIGKGVEVSAHKIHLYIPQGFALGDGANFGNIDLGVINAIQKNMAAGESGKSADVQDAEALAIGKAVIDKLGVDDSINAAAKTLEQKGIALNNQATLTFEGSTIRTFDLAFTMVANSAREARMIREIEHTFRKFMYAKKEGDFALRYPALFRIKFMKGKAVNPYMPKLFDSYLTGMNATYNNNGNMFHKDGAPTDLTISLSFQEQRQLTRDDLYREGKDPRQDFTWPA
jgi:hypothetical protein